MGQISFTLWSQVILKIEPPLGGQKKFFDFNVFGFKWNALDGITLLNNCKKIPKYGGLDDADPAIEMFNASYSPFKI